MKKLDTDLPTAISCGILSHVDVFERLEKNGAKPGAWVVKSIGPVENEGNDNPTYIEGGMNSFALPSMTHDDLEKELKQYRGNIPLIISHYGTPEECARSVARFDHFAIAHEINISCPNFKPGEQSVMETMCNTEKGLAVVKAVREATKTTIITKLSPNEDYVSIAKAIAPYTDYIGCGNTLGPGLLIDPYTGYPILAGKYGGISGEAIKPITQKMVHEVYQATKDQDVGIAASGGIGCGKDIISLARLGASRFQIGTALEKYKTVREKADAINRIWSEAQCFYEDELGVSSLEEIIGVNYV